MPNDRRDFLKTVGAGAAAVAAITKATEQPVAAAEQRTYTGGRFYIEIEGKIAGWLSSAEGGHATGQVVEQKFGEDGIIRKHLGAVKFDDISISFGADMAQPLFDWIKASFDHKHMRKDGAIVAADYNFNTVSVLKFSQALITEIGFPALDAASKEAAKMTLKFSPEFTEYKHNVAAPIIQEPPSTKQKKWLASNFRLRIKGLDESSSRVAKIDALTIKQQVAEYSNGDSRDYEKLPTHLEIPNLKITLPEHNSEDLFGWHQDFVVKGNNSDDKERSGSLEFLSSDLKTTLLALDFHHLGIFKYNPDGFSQNADRIRSVSAEMYCEEIKFRPPGSKLPPVSPDEVISVDQISADQ